MLKKGGRTPDDMLKEVAFTRYRGGGPVDFTTRLHYTTDWFHDNEQKKVVKLLGDLPGAEPYIVQVNAMSAHPENYRQLKAHPEMIPKLRQFEVAINSRTPLNYVPMAKLKDAESQLQTGDIVGVCGYEHGGDIPHTGLIYRDDAGVPHFMDASSLKRNYKVTIESGPISQSLNWAKYLTGAMFARPLDV